MMPHNLDLIFTLTGALVAALAFGLIARRIGLSPIVDFVCLFFSQHTGDTIKGLSRFHFLESRPNDGAGATAR